MTKTITPAPFGAAGLAFGNTTKAPYSPTRPHKGQDHQWRWLLPIQSKRTVAPVGGKIIAAYNDGGNHSGWGNYVDILVPSSTHRIIVRLAHHVTGSVSVKVGDTVKAGDSIGVMGATGETNGVHLHEELWINGVRVDPIYYRTHDLPGTTGGAPAGGGSGSTAGTGSKPGPTLTKPAVTSEEEADIMGASDDILAAISKVRQDVDVNTGRLRLEIRGHIFYDAGVNGDQPFETAKHAALMNGAGRLIVMETPPVNQETSWRRDTYKYTDTTRAAAANRQALTTAEFWNKIKDELTARSNDFYTVADAQAWFATRQKQIANQTKTGGE